MASDIVQALIEVGNGFAEGEFDYKWVAEDVLLSALREARKIMLDQNQMQATVQYYLGKLYSTSK